MIDGFAFVDAEARAINDVVALLFAALFIHDGDRAGTVHGDASAAAAFDVTKFDEPDDAGVPRFERGTLADAGCRSTDVERTHGKLRAGFADGLRGDDADGFAKFDHASGGEVAAITAERKLHGGIRR